jgi:hypothetical protein
VTTPTLRWFVVLPWVLTIGLFACLLAMAVIAGQTHDFEGGEATELVAFFGLIGLWGVLDRVGGELGAVVERTLAPTSVRVWLRPSARTTGR